MIVETKTNYNTGRFLGRQWDKCGVLLPDHIARPYVLDVAKSFIKLLIAYDNDHDPKDRGWVIQHGDSFDRHLEVTLGLYGWFVEVPIERWVEKKEWCRGNPAARN